MRKFLSSLLGASAILAALFVASPVFAKCEPTDTCVSSCGEGGSTKGVCPGSTVEKPLVCCDTAKDACLSPYACNAGATCDAKAGWVAVPGKKCASVGGAPLSCCKQNIVSGMSASDTGMIVGSSAKITNPLGANVDLLVILSRVIQAFLGLVGACSLLVFVYAGVRYMTAGGSADGVKEAKDTMKYAFLGLFFIMFAYAIANFFFKTLVSTPESASVAPAATLPTIPK